MIIWSFLQWIHVPHILVSCTRQTKMFITIDLVKFSCWLLFCLTFIVKIAQDEEKDALYFIQEPIWKITQGYMYNEMWCNSRLIETPTNDSHNNKLIKNSGKMLKNNSNENNSTLHTPFSRVLCYYYCIIFLYCDFLIVVENNNTDIRFWIHILCEPRS